MKTIIYLLGATMMASPLAPRGCETINVGLTYQGQYGDYTVKRAVVGQNKSWDILIDAHGKQIVPFER